SDSFDPRETRRWRERERIRSDRPKGRRARRGEETFFGASFPREEFAAAAEEVATEAAGAAVRGGFSAGPFGNRAACRAPRSRNSCSDRRFDRVPSVGRRRLA